jgi:protocatechuate 3,4-dioxygenase beta subunit
MKNIYLFLTAAFLLGLGACTKMDNTPPTELKLTVIDNNSNVVSGASVTLYEGQTDYQNNTNAVVSGLTDANGNIYFSNLSPIVYYYYIESGTLNNDYTTNHFSSALVPNVINVFDPITIAPPPPTQLKIQVIDNSGIPLSGASVTLYSSQIDFQNNTNPVATTTTDANGYMLFSGLSPIVYFYFIQDGCLDNYNGNTHLATALTANILNTYDPITLSSEGAIKLVNNSSDPYEVKLDGNVVVASLQASGTAVIDEVLAGTHTIEVVQMDGPNDETINGVSVSCGTTTTVNFP